MWWPDARHVSAEAGRGGACLGVLIWAGPVASCETPKITICLTGDIFGNVLPSCPGAVRNRMKRFGEVVHILVVTGILLTLTLAAFVWISSESRWRELDRAYLSADHSARVFAEQVERTIRSIDADLRFTAYELARDNSPDRLRSLVHVGALSMDLLVQIAMVDAQGRTLATHVGPDPNRTDVSDREHIRVHLDRKVSGLFVGRPVLGRVSGRWAIQLSRAVESADGTLVGVLVASLDPLYFERFWAANALGEGNFVKLLGNDGFPRTSSRNAERIFLSQKARPDVISRATGPSGRLLFNDSDGLTRLAAYARLSAFPLVVISGFPAAAVEERIRAERAIYLMVASSVCIMVAMLGGWLSYLAFRLRVQEEEALLARRRLSDAVEAIPEGFALFDAQDRLVIVNGAFRRIHSRQGNFVKIGMTFEDFCRLGVRAGLWKVVGDEEQWIQAKLARHRNPVGAFEVELAHGAWLRVSERRTAEGGIVGIRTDITDAKAREETLIQSRSALAAQAEEMRTLADAAMQADRAKSAFLAAMSHEIRTPLNALLGFTRLLARTDLDEEQRDFVKVVDQSASHLKGIVNDVLEFSQLEAGRVSIDNAPFDPRELIDHLKSVLGVLIGGKPIEVRCIIDESVPPSLTGDASRIYQVLLNIAGNAAKFTDTGGIEVRVEFQHSEAGSVVRFVIEDTGRGITPEAMERLFKPFEQGDATGELRAAGTGLGLAISSGLVKKMGGSIGVESKHGAGSRFWFELPLEPSAPQPARAMREYAKAADSPRKLNVLVTDDAPSSRKLVRVLVEKAGHRVREAGDGREAIKAAAAERFDLILLDLQMPVMGGIEAARRIRLLPAPHGTAVLAALTAQVMASDRDAALRSGMDIFIPKPVEAEQLLALLAEVSDADPTVLVTQATDSA